MCRTRCNDPNPALGCAAVLFTAAWQAADSWRKPHSACTNTLCKPASYALHFRYPTTLADDEQVAKGAGQLAPKLQAALAARLPEKRCLAELRAWAPGAHAELYQHPSRAWQAAWKQREAMSRRRRRGSSDGDSDSDNGSDSDTGSGGSESSSEEGVSGDGSGEDTGGSGGGSDDDDGGKSSSGSGDEAAHGASHRAVGSKRRAGSEKDGARGAKQCRTAAADTSKAKNTSGSKRKGRKEPSSNRTESSGGAVGTASSAPSFSFNFAV